MGNVEEQVEGYYPAVRSHNVLEASETQWGLNQVELENIDFQGSLLESPLDDGVYDMPEFVLEERLQNFVENYLSSVYPDEDFGDVVIPVELFS